jgi:hypothetical protein
MATGPRRGDPPPLGSQLRMKFDEPERSAVPAIRSRARLPRSTAVFESFWRFAYERQEIFFKRLVGIAPPWTADPILAEYKFTNAYRASDRVSQYLIRRVIYRDDLPGSPEEVFFRVILFKLFNKIETWEALEQAVGPLTAADYAVERYSTVLAAIKRLGQPIYSAAYIMPPGERPSSGSAVKHESHLRLLERMLADALPARIASAPSMQHGFELLRGYPMIGDFLAYQFITDLAYSEIASFSEMEFVVPGPGARDGIQKCFPDRDRLSEQDIIRLTAERQEQEFARRGLAFRSLFGRPLQFIDCQNLFCEIAKYARVAHPEIAGRLSRMRIKQKYRPLHSPIRYWYPPKWGINAAVAAYQDRHGTGQEGERMHGEQCTR